MPTAGHCNCTPLDNPFGQHNGPQCGHYYWRSCEGGSRDWMEQAYAVALQKQCAVDSNQLEGMDKRNTCIYYMYTVDA